jgi:outer membrane protein assembly factor BamB
MLKAIRSLPARLLTSAIVVAAIGGCAGGCAGKRAIEHPLAFELSDQPQSVKRLWQRKMPGFITDLSAAKDGRSLLVATIPDYDSDQSPKQYSVAQLSAEDGKTRWSLPVQSQVKSLDLAEDGSLGVIAHYNGELQGVSADGKQAWVTEVTCRPFLLSSLKKVVCYHDDDAEPRVAFDVLDWSGKKLLSHRITQDVLALKISRDERNLAIGLTQGSVVFFRTDTFKPAWTRKVDGEILDVAVSSGPEPIIAVLHHSVKKGQKLSWIDFKGRIRGEGVPVAHVEQVEASPDGDAVLVYGNGPRGQSIALFQADDDSLKEKWSRGDSRYADYSSSMIVAGGLAIIGFEDLAAKGRHSHLLGFDFAGKLKWNLPLVTEEGAYLYAQSYAPDRSFLAVGTDDANLSGYQILPAAK